MPSVLNFDSPSYTVDPKQDSMAVTVLRTGDTADPARVDYKVVRGTASPGAHFAESHGTLEFGSGVTTRLRRSWSAT